MIAAEITREKLTLRLHEELPYQLTVETENWEEREGRLGPHRPDRLCRPRRAQGHRAGPQGRDDQGRSGQLARAELEEFLGRRVHLFLQVKVRPNWLDEAERYSEMGLDFSDGNA